ncbi:glycosyltransferase [Marinobacterium jannaschii]|uniref:glycosyltransferase n=1 Tax=Marinobacterium jannaschii TaxID=64970 RepID=UPI00048024D0|nr:glycosyltransferase [Marinobacterium jannaschii]
MKQVLIIGYVWPEPDSSAAGRRMMELIELFQQQDWQVEFASPAALSDHMPDLAAAGIRTRSIALNCSSFDQYVAELQPDIVMFDRFMMEEQFGWRVEKQCPDALRILDTEDLHCLRNARHQALKQGREVSPQDLMGDMAVREVAAILRCDLTLMISSTEIELLTRQFKVDPALLHHLTFMLPALDEDQRNQWPAFSERKHFVTIGNFRHAPNWDSVLYLKQTIWPLIRKRLPEAQMHIYGAYPPKKATQLDNPRERFRVLGWAEDAEAVMRNARLCLAPLRFGAGIKGKLVEAMLCGTPSVTTSVGAEAMHGTLPWNGVVADEPQQIADAAVALYQDQALWQQSQAYADAILQQFYDGESQGRALLARIDLLLNNLQQHRLNNFTGQMLRHHSMKSTQYMSQWIEAKNR